MKPRYRVLEGTMTNRETTMIDRRAYQTAFDLVKQHGDQASFVAELITEAISQYNDAELFILWSDISRTTRTLLKKGSGSESSKMN